jgi:flagellar motor switch protein FliM
VDDILKLNSGPEDPIVVTVEDVPKFYGSPGVVKGNRAVQIIDIMEKKGG